MGHFFAFFCEFYENNSALSSLKTNQCEFLGLIEWFLIFLKRRSHIHFFQEILIPNYSQDDIVLKAAISNMHVSPSRKQS